MVNLLQVLNGTYAPTITKRGNGNINGHLLSHYGQNLNTIIFWTTLVISPCHAFHFLILYHNKILSHILVTDVYFHICPFVTTSPA